MNAYLNARTHRNALVSAGLPVEKAQLWVALCEAEQVDISAETVAQLEVALRAGNREELLRLLRVAHVDAAAAEQALERIAAGGSVRDVVDTAQRLEELRTALAYALTHRVKPESAVEQADAVRPAAQKAERKVRERRARARESDKRTRGGKRIEPAILRVELAALREGCADLQRRCDASEAKLCELREATSEESVLRAFAVAEKNDQVALAAASLARNADLAQIFYRAATDALAGEASAWAPVQASHGLSGDGAAARAAVGRSQAVVTAVRHELDDLGGAGAFSASLEQSGLRARAEEISRGEGKRKVSSGAHAASPRKSQRPARADARARDSEPVPGPAPSPTPEGAGRAHPAAAVEASRKAIEMRRIGDASWRWFRSQTDAAEAFGISEVEVSRLVNGRSDRIRKEESSVGWFGRHERKPRKQFEARRVT
mmetsp:Transcript_5694/g.14462  ORF Transcript_5694/g.14462 Transcript_5694/m.14462 type:complete len:433 (+) Transcript_5694:41-1339(+)